MPSMPTERSLRVTLNRHHRHGNRRCSLAIILPPFRPGSRIAAQPIKHIAGRPRVMVVSSFTEPAVCPVRVPRGAGWQHPISGRLLWRRDP